MSQQNSHIFSFYNRLSLIRTTDTKSRPQRVNSYKLNLFITDTEVIRWIPVPDHVNLHRVNPVWLMSYARWLQKPSRWISKNGLRKVHRGTLPPFSGLNKREELFCYILYCSYCLLHLQNSKRRFQNLLYFSTFYIQYWAVARFVLKEGLNGVNR